MLCLHKFLCYSVCNENQVPYEPRSKVASLQALFAMMQHTRRKFIDPADFICKLGLNPSVQQDAQEFSKLFISLLEDSLMHQSSMMVKTMIQNQFRGEYAYVTKCSNCQRESVSRIYLRLASDHSLIFEHMFPGPANPLL